MAKQPVFTHAELQLAAKLVLKNCNSGCTATVKHDVVQQLLGCGFDLQHSKQLVEAVQIPLLP